jgi:hypothetical protein
MTDESFDHVVLNVMERCTTDSFIYKCLIQNGIISGYDIMALNETVIDSMLYIPTDNIGNIAQRVGLHVAAKNRLDILVKYLRSATSAFKGRITANDFIKATCRNDYNGFRFGLHFNGFSYDFKWSSSENIVSHLESNIIPIVELNIIERTDSTCSIINKSLVDKTVNNVKQDYISGKIIQNVIKNDTNVFIAKENITISIDNTCDILLPHAKQRHDVTFTKQHHYVSKLLYHNISKPRHDVMFAKQHHYISKLLYYCDKIISTTNQTSNVFIFWFMFCIAAIIFVNVIMVMHCVYDENCIYDPGGNCFWNELLNYISNDSICLTTFVCIGFRLWRGDIIVLHSSPSQLCLLELRFGLWRGVKITSVLVCCIS